MGTERDGTQETMYEGVEVDETNEICKKKCTEKARETKRLIERSTSRDV